jgi:hypothetical protein
VNLRRKTVSALKGAGSKPAAHKKPFAAANEAASSTNNVASALPLLGERAGVRGSLKPLKPPELARQPRPQPRTAGRIALCRETRIFRNVIFFDYFALLLVAAFLAVSFLHTRRPNLFKPRTLTMFVTALILYYPISGLMIAGAYLSLIARPVGVVLAILSFRLLCLDLLERT